MQVSSQTKPMYIYQHGNDGSTQNVQNSHEKTAQAEKEALLIVPKGDSVQFSSDAKLLAEANRVAMQEGVSDSERTEKVSQLRAQVQDGTYTVDDKALAQGLVREERSLFV